jgi:uncharacterized protein (DUF4415 family)
MTGNWVRYSVDDIRALESETDWDRVDRMTDEDIDRAIADDPDWQGLENLEDLDWSKAELILPQTKTAISIRLDADVLAFFKADGPGYQRRINAVLRSYMVARRKAEPTG